MINLYHYLADNCGDEFMSAAGDTGLTFSSEMNSVETTSMINNVGLDISQLRIFLRILSYKLGATLFEPEYKTK